MLKGSLGVKATARYITLHAGPAFPFARRGLGTAIGELYDVTEQVLKILDALEGHPNFYKRELVDVVAEGKKERAWIYLCQEQALKYPMIEDGEWKR